MQNHVIPVSFALTTRMQSFIEMRDALRCLSQAVANNAPYAWLPAAKDIHDLLIGEGHKKPATPNILSLFGSIRKHYLSLGKKHPEFQDKLKRACDEIDNRTEAIHQQIPPAIEFLTSDAWLTAYTESIRTQDILAHKSGLPQLILPLWHGDVQHARKLQLLLEPLISTIEYINQMLHTHAPWEHRTAKLGYDQVTLKAQDDIGLIIIGVPQHAISQGVIPSCSGFRSVVRIRFSQWQPGEVAQDLKFDQNYSLMLVPFS